MVSTLWTTLRLSSGMNELPAFCAGLPVRTGDHLTARALMGGEARAAQVAFTHRALCWKVTERKLVQAPRAPGAATAGKGCVECANVLGTYVTLAATFTVVADHPGAESTDEVGGMSRRHRT